MTLLDTNVLIEILKGNEWTRQTVENLDDRLAISSISAMELFYGALNKAESKKLERFVSLFHMLHIDESISIQAMKLIQTYAKSHGLDIPDSLIAATAKVHDCRLMTYNLKDFRFIKGLEIAPISS